MDSPLGKLKPEVEKLDLAPMTSLTLLKWLFSPCSFCVTSLVHSVLFLLPFFGSLLRDCKLLLAHRWVLRNPQGKKEQARFIYFNGAGRTCLQCPPEVVGGRTQVHGAFSFPFTQTSLRRRKTFLGQWCLLLVWYYHSFWISWSPPQN